MKPDCDREKVLKTLQRDTWGYMITLGPLGLGSLTLLPLMMHLLSPAELGWLAVAEALMVPAGTVGMMGLKFAYLYRFAHSTPAQRSALLATCLALGGLISLGCGFAMAALAIHPAFLTRVGWEGPVPIKHPWLLVMLIPTGTLQALLITELRANRALGDTGWVSYGQLATTIAATTWMTAGLGWGLDGFLGGQLAGQAVGLCHTAERLVSRRYLSKEGIHRFECSVQFGEMPRLLSYGWPLTLGLLLRYGMDSLARIMLATFGSLESVSDWLVVSRVLSVFDVLVANPFLMAWGGLLHHVLRRSDAPQVASCVSKWAITFSSVAVVAASIGFFPLTQLMMSQSQPELASLYCLLLWTKWMAVNKSSLCCGVQQDGRTGWAIHSNMTAIIIFVPLAWLALRPENQLTGAIGVAGAMLLSTLVSTVLLYMKSQQKVPQHLGMNSWGIILLTISATGLILIF